MTRPHRSTRTQTRHAARRLSASALAALLAACAATGIDDPSRDAGSYELISERYIRGPGDTIGSAGPRARGTTECVYVNRETGAQEVRRYPGGLPCPPIG